jgi:hypothetical protein
MHYKTGQMRYQQQQAVQQHQQQAVQQHQQQQAAVDRGEII